MLSKTESAPAPKAATVSGPGWTALLLATVAVAAALRFYRLQSGLWYDEIMTLVMSVRHPIRQIVTHFPGMNEHPLFSVLAHASIAAFGESAWALRLPACFFGIASVVMVYVLAARMMPRVEAWAAAATLATFYHHVWFSQNARGYTIIGFMTLVSTYSLLRATERDRTRDLVVYGLACVLGAYTHLTMGFIIAGHAAVVVLGHLAGWGRAMNSPLRRLMWTWAAIAIISALLYAPLVPGILATFSLGASQAAVAVATPSWAVAETIRSLLTGAGAASLVAAAFAALGALSIWRREPFVVALLLAPALVSGIGTFVLRQPIRPRFFFFLSGAAALFVGRGIGWAVDAVVARDAADRPRVLLLATIGCTLALAALSAAALPRNYRVPKQDFDGAVRVIDAAEAEGLSIAGAGPACTPLQLYYNKTAMRCLRRIEDWRDMRIPGRPVMVAYTLPDYINRELRETLRNECPVVQRFEGTLGGGDILVCRTP